MKKAKLNLQGSSRRVDPPESSNSSSSDEFESGADEDVKVLSPIEVKLREKCSEYGLAAPSAEVLELINKAAEEKMKRILKKVVIVVNHRATLVKYAWNHEPTTINHDIKTQLKVFEDIDRLGKKRHENRERQKFLDIVAKVTELKTDAELGKVDLKAKAKEARIVKKADLNWRDLNSTALQFIGPRKRTYSNSTPNIPVIPVTGVKGRPVIPNIMKTVHVNDLITVLEREKHTRNSNFLYKLMAHKEL